MSVSHERFDDALLAAVTARIGDLYDATPDGFLPELRRLVTETLSTVRPDGSTPDPELLAEILRAYLDVFDDRAPVLGLDRLEATAEGAWIRAWRECTTNPALLDGMIRALHEDEPTAGIPRLAPPDDLPFTIEP